MSDISSKDRDVQLRLPKRTAAAADEMSVDTRVAAQAIINDDAIGVHYPPFVSHDQRSRVIEWLLQ